MTQHSQNGEGVEDRHPGCDEVPTLEQATRWLGKFSSQEEVMSTTPRKIAFELAGIHSLLQSLAREPATADVGREIVEALGHLEWLCGIAYNQGGAHELGYDPLAVVRDALSRAAPSSEPAIAEGERALERWTAEKPIAASYDDNRQWQVAVLAWEKRKPATTPPTTNDAIPAGMMRWDGGDSAPADWDGGPVFADDHRFYRPDEWDGKGLDWKHGLSERGIGADIIAYTPKASAAPSAPATEAGEEA